LLDVFRSRYIIEIQELYILDILELYEAWQVWTGDSMRPQESGHGLEIDQRQVGF
jgi:hypothetical protein